MTKAVKVIPRNWYSLQDIVRDGLFPWVSSFGSVRDIVAKDIASRNLLKATIKGEGRGKKYLFKGVHIIKFVSAVEAGKVRL
jgi:hypothetical protein